MTQPVDRAYTNLLNHLQRPSPRLPTQTVFSTVPHYLSCLPLPHPTQLTAFVLSSSLWQPPSVESLWSLVNAFRSAVHLKKANIKKEATGWFSRDTSTVLGEWVWGVMKGLSRGDAQLRVALFGGLLLGLEDLRHEESRNQIRGRLESQIVILCAEVLETFSTNLDVWVKEFTTRESGKHENPTGTIFLHIACQILPLVDSSKLRVLDLLVLVRLSERALKNLFLEGSFLNELTLATGRDSSGKITISSESSLFNSLQSISKNPLYRTAGPLAKLLSLSLSQLVEDRPVETWHTFHDTCESLESITYRVENDWKSSILATVTSEEDIAPQSRETSAEIWLILKTLLFSHLLVSQSIISNIPYITLLQATVSEPGPSSIARSVLRSLHHLSFILSHFGGVTSSGEGFKELKRVFYTALDIVAADQNIVASHSFVEELLSSQDSHIDSRHPFWQAKTVYALTVVEQLVPVLSEAILESRVIPFCLSHLNNPQNRETYESAHSVVLSIFAEHAQRMEGEHASQRPTFAERLVPFYVNSLIENSSEGRLSRAQLKLAYSSLVRSAASSGDDALAWLCIEALLSRIEGFASDPARPMDLYVTLVSLISCVPLSLMLRELEEVEKTLHAVDGEDRKTLGAAVLDEITNRVGDRERAVALRWWSDVAPRLAKNEEEADD